MMARYGHDVNIQPAATASLEPPRMSRWRRDHEPAILSAVRTPERPDRTQEVTMRSLVRLAGRALLAAPFVVLGYEAAAEPGGRVQLAEAMGVPQPELAVRLNGAAMAAGGLALATGVFPRLAATGLVASLVPTTVAGHPYWQMTDPQARKTNRIQVLKNAGLAGALLLTAAERRRRDDRAGDTPDAD
jgi:putative oxidoreductase